MWFKTCSRPSTHVILMTTHCWRSTGNTQEKTPRRKRKGDSAGRSSDHLASIDLVLDLVGEGDVHPGSFKGRVLDALPGPRDSVQTHTELEIVAGTLQRRFHSLDVGIQVIAPNPQRFEAQLLHRL
jgi:hypothetical protein